MIDAEGRVDRFKRKYAKFQDAKSPDTKAAESKPQ